MTIFVAGQDDKFWLSDLDLKEWMTWVSGKTGWMG
jgi:hypothetical protein